MVNVEILETSLPFVSEKIFGPSLLFKQPPPPQHENNFYS